MKGRPAASASGWMRWSRIQARCAPAEVPFNVPDTVVTASVPEQATRRDR
jgi:hypothetical protein